MRHDDSGSRGAAFRATGDTSAFGVGSEETTYRDNIVSLDADGFSVESEGGSGMFQGNVSGRTYTYVALGA
jgi:hypothetical protein